MIHQQTPNRLIHEQSRYLLQHAYNPVAWYPWGDEALQMARQHDKPILLSIGYSACHWCHVMAHESFEDPITAEIMNRHFINIKVDREERPDVDSLYMNTVVAMSGQGGWPMTVFLFPDGTPFFGGTYFPPDNKAAHYNMPSFTQILTALANAYYTQRDELHTLGTNVLAHIQQKPAAQQTTTPHPETTMVLAVGVLDMAYTRLQHMFDNDNGGFGNAPKFPQPMALAFLLQWHLRTANNKALTMLETTLQHMAHGGIYDQLGGGFHRYSVDKNWITPHFEKMLYDNALLAQLYAQTYQVTHNSFYRRITDETLDYLAREMRHTAGGFFSTQDADTDEGEGHFFVWTPNDVQQVLGEDAPLFCDIFGITPHGNFEGHTTILHRPRSLEEIAHKTGNTLEALETLIARGRDMLFNHREQRTKPGRDEKIITAWNGMALSAYAIAAGAFGNERYREIAQHTADFLLRHMYQPNGRVFRNWSDTTDSYTRIPGFLEDYALLADGLLALYRVDANSRWLTTAIALANSMVALFWDETSGTFYDTAHDHDQLVIRPCDPTDNATPSGTSVAIDVLLQIATITDNATYRAHAEHVLAAMVPALHDMPLFHGRLLCAADRILARQHEVVLVGNPAAPDMRALMDVVLRRFYPSLIVAYNTPNTPANIAALPLLQHREMIAQRATAYVCEGFACKQPVTDADTLRQQLQHPHQ